MEFKSSEPNIILEQKEDFYITRKRLLEDKLQRIQLCVTVLKSTNDKQFKYTQQITLLLIAVISLILKQMIAINNCYWISVVNKNATLRKLHVHTRTHIRISIKHYTSNILSLSIVSDHVATTAACKYLNVRKQMNGTALISIFS
ncbi:unnamed protein product [Brugia timori]|uniref:Transmembrane protein n=1 Tax=Brugia timori TaxID=42155 RepID=A0A0R3QIF7_9BILA|nr:unnamed protein product [Brugia timori]